MTNTITTPQRVIRFIYLILLLSFLFLSGCNQRQNSLGFIIELQIDQSDDIGIQVQRVSSLKEALTSANIETESFSELPIFFVKNLSEEQQSWINEGFNIKGIYPVQEYRTHTSQSLALIDQPIANQEGATGKGNTVVVLDTGADYTHPNLGGCSSSGGSCRVIEAFDTAAEDNVRDTADRHGTNVASIIAAVAPDANIVAIDVFELNGNGEERTNDRAILSALNWVLFNQSRYNIVAVNLSLGNDAITGTCPAQIYDSAFFRLRNAGVAIIASSGNNANKNALSSPSCHPLATSIGAVSDWQLPATQYKSCSEPSIQRAVVTCFSNSSGQLDLLAPGAVISAGGVNQSGTSQAAPHVSGGIAALKTAHPHLSSAQIVNQLKDTGSLITDVNGITTPLINLAAFSNEPPIAIADTAKSDEGSGTVIDVLANDTDEEKDSLRISKVIMPAGTKGYPTEDGIYFTSEKGVTGKVSFTYEVKDRYEALATGTVTVEIAKLDSSKIFQFADYKVPHQSQVVQIPSGKFLYWTDGANLYYQKLSSLGAPTGKVFTIANEKSTDLNLAVKGDYVTAVSRNDRQIFVSETHKGKVTRGTQEFHKPQKPRGISRLFAVPMRFGVVIGWGDAIEPTGIYAKKWSGGYSPRPHPKTIQTIESQKLTSVEERIVRITDDAYAHFNVTFRNVAMRKVDFNGKQPWGSRKLLFSNQYETIGDFEIIKTPRGYNSVRSHGQYAGARKISTSRFDANGNQIGDSLDILKDEVRGINEVEIIEFPGFRYRAFWIKEHRTGSNGRSFYAILSADLSETTIGRTRIEYLTENVAGIRQIEAAAIDTNKYYFTWWNDEGKLQAQSRM